MKKNFCSEKHIWQNINSIKIYDHGISDCIIVSYLNSLLRQNAESRIHENQNTLIWQFCSVICNSRIHKNQNTLICSPAQSFAIAEYKQALRKCHFLIKVLPDMVQGQNRDHCQLTHTKNAVQKYIISFCLSPLTCT